MNKTIRFLSIILSFLLIFTLFPTTVFAADVYTVSFDANGGTGTMTSVNNVSGDYTLPPNGFTPPANKQFKCWSVNGNDKNPFESISVTADVTVKAIWKDITATTYTISFNGNGGSGSMANVTNAPSFYTLPSNGFTPPANKQFKCWAVGAQNDEYDPGDKITITANVTVKAVWEDITSSRQVISDVVATSSDLDTILKLYGLLKIPTFNITQGAPAYINASTSNLRWQKKIGGVWTNQDSGRFTPGEWRISSSLRIDGTDGYSYELGNPTTLTVNGQAWTVENDGKPSVHPNYSHANILSPTFIIVDDPNVQPPIPVPSVDMVLKGYQVGAPVSAATVETDAMVDVELLGILEVIDSDQDGQPDNVALATGTFKTDTVYAAAISLRAKNGYDISVLTAQTVSLDRSLFDLAEEGSDDETFTGMYLLDDIVQNTVTFETNGGSTISPIQVSRGKTLAPPADPTRAYYAFAGWYSDSNLTQAFDFNTPIDSDITLYAKWTPSPVGGMFLMTFDFNGGTSTMPSSGEVPAGSEIYFETGETIQSVVTPPSGKAFDAYEIDGVRYEHGDEYFVTQNFTLKFLWKDAPAGHTCDIKPVQKVDPSCTEGGKEAYYKCEGCGKFYEDALGTKIITDLAAWGNLAKNPHTESDWKSDKDNHWKECTVADCGTVILNSKSAHKDDNKDHKCDVCARNLGTTSTPDSTQKPADKPQSPQTGAHSVLWFLFALLFVSGGFSFTFYQKTKIFKK